MAVLTSTHNLFFGGKVRKIIFTSCKSQFYYIKVGFKGGGSKLFRHVFVIKPEEAEK